MKTTTTRFTTGISWEEVGAGEAARIFLQCGPSTAYASIQRVTPCWILWALTTPKPYRGAGHATRLVGEMVRLAHLDGCHARLTCKPDVFKFYIRRGWTVVDVHDRKDGTSLVREVK